MTRNIQSQQFVQLKRSRGLAMSIMEKSEIAAAAEIWHAVEAQVEHVPLTNTWEWVESWLTHFGSLVDFWFIVGMKHNKPCGIALVTKETHRPLPFPVKAYHIGTNGEPFEDRIRMTNNAILATHETKSRFSAAVIDAVMTAFSVEELVFDDYDKDEAATISKALKKMQFKTVVEEEPTLFLDLETLRKTNSDVITAFGSNMRRSVRRSLKVFDDLSVEWAETPDEALDILEELIVLYQEAQQKLGRPGMFTSTHFTNFQRDIIPKLIRQNRVILFRVRSKKFGTVGCLYMFVDNNIAYSYQIGLNDFSDIAFEEISSNRLKTSYIIHALCMRECLNRGLSAYNFLTGVYRFKTQMTNGETNVVSISVRKSIKPLLRDSIMSLYAKLDESRNSPTLLRYFRTLVRRNNKEEKTLAL